VSCHVKKIKIFSVHVNSFQYAHSSAMQRLSQVSTF
jgi:hypothetical protein